jgi:hypothetical protein
VHLLVGAEREDYGASPKIVSRDMQTRDARCGEHGESRMVRPLCTNRMPPPRGTDANGMTCARTADRSLYFLLLAVEWMLVEPLLSRAKTLATKT